MINRTHRQRGMALALSLTMTLAAGTAFAAGQVGETAAPFTLEALGGGNQSLSDYPGQVIFLAVIGYG